MPRTNPAAIAPLPSAQKAYTDAFLIEYSVVPDSNDRLWTFQYNPQNLRFSGDAKYSEAATFAAREQDYQFGYSSGLLLEINNIVLDTYCLGKSLQPLLDGLNELRKANLENSQFNPKILSFIWGSRRFAPCVLTRCSWDESAWLAGEPARALLNLTLQEIPKPGERGFKAMPSEPIQQTDAPADAGKPRSPLTDRQKQDAFTQAKTWLQANKAQFDARTQQLVQSNAYRINTDPTSGDVSLLDAKNTPIGVVGRWDGKTWLTDAINSLPTASFKQIVAAQPK